MTLEGWAEKLVAETASPETIDLHVKDTFAAYLAGLKTVDGQALQELYRGHENICDRAAVTSAITRLSESDDIHLPSCVTPGSVVVPVALSLGHVQAHTLERAICAGYSAGLTLGVAIGGAKALAHGIWPTLLAAPLMAAVTASIAQGQTQQQLAHAMALALAGASGRIGRPAGMRSGRWFLFADAVAKGLRAANAAGAGVTGDLTLISDAWVAAQAGHGGIDMTVFERDPPSISDVGFKPFPVARQGMNAVIAFQTLLSRRPEWRGADTIKVFVAPMNAALLSRPVARDDRLSRVANIGYQLACAALDPDRLYDPERPWSDEIMSFASRVTVEADASFDTYLPSRWPAKVVVQAGNSFVEETVIGTDLDQDAPNLSGQVKEKWRRMLGSDDAAAMKGGQWIENAAHWLASRSKR